MSLFSRANANWAAVGFPFGIIFLANVINDSEKKFKKYYIFFSQFLLSLVIVILILLGQNNIKLDPFSKQRHARDLACNTRITNIANVAFMADDREDYAIMLFYIKSYKVKKAKWNGDNKIDDHYELTTNANNLKGYNLLFLTRTAPTKVMISRSSSQKLIKELHFHIVEKLKNIIYICFLIGIKASNLAK